MLHVEQNQDAKRHVHAHKNCNIQYQAVSRRYERRNEYTKGKRRYCAKPTDNCSLKPPKNTKVELTIWHACLHAEAPQFAIAHAQKRP